MFLHLLRHADAGDATGWSGPDAARPLSKKGRGQSERLGRFLADTAFRPDLFVSSPKVRAVETAEIVAAPLGTTVAVDDRLGDALDLAIVDDILEAHGQPESPVLVGHDPDFSELVAILCGGEVPMRKGALARIEVARPLTPGAGTLRWLVPPDLLRP